jgi:hypothetical protein
MHAGERVHVDLIATNTVCQLTVAIGGYFHCNCVVIRGFNQPAKAFSWIEDRRPLTHPHRLLLHEKVVKGCCRILMLDSSRVVRYLDDMGILFWPIIILATGPGYNYNNPQSNFVTRGVTHPIHKHILFEFGVISFQMVGTHSWLFYQMG